MTEDPGGHFDNAHMRHLVNLVRRRLKDKELMDSEEDVLHDFSIDVFDVLGEYVLAALSGRHETPMTWSESDVAEWAVTLGETTLRRTFDRAMLLASVAIRKAAREGEP